MVEHTISWIFFSVTTAFFLRVSAKVRYAGLVGLGLGGGGYYLLTGILVTFQSPLALTSTNVLFLCSGVCSFLIFFSSMKFSRRFDRSELSHRNRCSSANPLPERSWLVTAALGFYLISLLIVAVYQNIYTPAQAWDFLDAWGPLTQKRILCFADGVAESGCWPPDGWMRHPATLGAILADRPFHLISHEAHSLPSIIWFHMTISFFLLIAGFFLVMTRSINLALFGCAVWISIPLIDNHVQLIGYVEIWILFCLMSAIIALALYYYSGALMFCVFAAFFVAAPVMLKNVGVIYSASIVISAVSWAVVFEANARLRKSLVWIFITVVFIILTLCIDAVYSSSTVFGADLNGLENSVAVLQSKRIEFGGRSLRLILPSLEQLFQVEFTSKVLMASFGVSVVLVISLIFLAFAMISFLQWDLRDRIFLLVLSSNLLILLCLFGSLFTDIGYRHAIPHQDTGHSRFSVLAFGLLPLAMISFDRASEKFKLHRLE